MSAKARNMRAVYHALRERRPPNWSMVAQSEFLLIRGAPGMKGGNTGPRRRAKFKVTPTAEDAISVVTIVLIQSNAPTTDPVTFAGCHFAEDFYRWAHEQLEALR